MVVLMNKRILAILTLLIMVASISAVSAFDLGDLFSSDETVTIGGFDFKIPDGFKEDTKLSSDNETYDVEPYFNFTVSSKTFVNESGDEIYIGVSESEINVTDDGVSQIADDTKNLTINGVKGYEYKESDDLVGFTYAKDGKMVLITLSDKELLDDIIMA